MVTEDLGSGLRMENIQLAGRGNFTSFPEIMALTPCWMPELGCCSVPYPGWGWDSAFPPQGLLSPRLRPPGTPPSSPAQAPTAIQQGHLKAMFFLTLRYVPDCTGCPCPVPAFHSAPLVESRGHRAALF